MGTKAQFTFNTFANGLSNDPNKWKTHGYYSAGIDLVGVKDIGSNITGVRPNTLQLAPELKRDSVSGSTVAGLVQWIRKFGTNYYGFIPNTSSGGEGLIVSTDGSKAWVSAKYTSAAHGGGGFEQLGVNTLYYSQNAVLGRLSSDGTYNNNFASFTNTSTTTPRPSKVFAGVLNIGDANLIATVDSSGTFTAAALTLPVGFNVRSLEVLGNYLVISTDNGAFARIFLWTGGTATYQEAYDLPETQAPPLISREGRVFAIGTSIYQLGETSFNTLFPFNYYGGASNVIPTAGQVTNWKNRILYGLSHGSGGTTNADDPGGVYLLGQYDASYPLINSLYGLIPTQVTSASNYTYAPHGVTLGGLYTDHAANVKVAFRDVNATATSAQYGIASLDADSMTESIYAYYLTLPLTMDTDNKKLFHSVRLNFTGTTGSTAVQISVYYRLDTDFSAGLNMGNWTLAKTQTTTDKQITIPIRKVGRNIMLKFLLDSNDTENNQGPQLLDYTVNYEVLDTYR